MSSTDPVFKTIAKNKKAYFDFEILEKLEVGIALAGCEVKSLRLGQVSLRDAYAKILNDELWLVGFQIQPYPMAQQTALEVRRNRKLLIRRKQLEKWRGKVDEKQITILPLELYFKGHLVKLSIGLGRSKKMYDKRAVLKEKDQKRAVDRSLKYY